MNPDDQVLELIRKKQGMTVDELHSEIRKLRILKYREHIRKCLWRLHAKDLIWISLDFRYYPKEW